MLSKFTASESLREIGERAFSNCRSLRSVQLNDGLETVSEYCFEATGVDAVEVPSSVREIRKWTFSRCDKLKCVGLNEGLEVLYRNFSDYYPVSRLSLSSSAPLINAKIARHSSISKNFARQCARLYKDNSLIAGII